MFENRVPQLCGLGRVLFFLWLPVFTFVKQGVHLSPS